MAHFAQLDENNVVTQVIVVHNNELVISKQTIVNEDGSVSVRVIESEENGIQFCKSLLGDDTNWVQTSYNGNFRGKFASIGDTYDVENNIFVPPVIEEVVAEPEIVDAPVVESVEVTTPVVEPEVVVEALQTVDIPMLTTDDIQALSSADIPALSTSDISSLG